MGGDDGALTIRTWGFRSNSATEEPQSLENHLHALTSDHREQIRGLIRRLLNAAHRFQF